MTQVAERTGVTLASLHKSLAGDGNPKLCTISKVTKTFDCGMAVV